MMCADTWIITAVTKLCGHCCNRSCGDTWCLHSFCCEQKHSDFGHCCNTWSTTVTLLWCSFAARSCDKHTDLLLLTCPGDSVCTCSPCVLLGFYACFALVRPHYLTDIHVSSAGNYTPLNEWPSFRKASVFITWPKRSLVVKVDLVDLLVQRCIFILSVFLIMSSDVFGRPCEWKPRPASNTPCFLFLYLRYHLKEIIPNMIIWGSTSKSRNKNKKRLWKCSRALKWNCTEGRHHSA